MGNLYWFVEPVVLLLLKKKGRPYGYDLSSDLPAHALTDAEIERAALYRTLRRLEINGNVKSEWDTGKGGPARRLCKPLRSGLLAGPETTRLYWLLPDRDVFWASVRER